MSNIVNPYETPSQFISEGPVYHPTEYSAHLLRKAWIYRKLSLSGPFPAVIEYNGWGAGYETVRVDGLIAAQAVGSFNLAPRFDFLIRTAYGIAPACIEVRSLAMFLRGIRLGVDGRCVYAEGAW